MQLNLPEVEDDASVAAEETAGVPVLYPELGSEDPESDVEAPQAVASDVEASETEVSENEEQLVVSEWPDPNKPTAIASLETRGADDDKDASANG